MQNNLTRRDFIQTSAAGAAAVTIGGIVPGCAGAKTSMPTRVFGKTGLEASMLSFGGGSQFLRNEDGAWEPMLERAIELGINWFDTASSYQNSDGTTSEERFGEILPRYRKKIILSTKFDPREPSEAMAEFERSLERMKTDYVDVLMIHSIEPSDDVSELERGVYREMVRLKEEGAVRFIGFSSMNSAERSAECIRNLDFDMTLLAMNPTGYGDFVSLALPAAAEKNLGVLAMKVMRDIVGDAAGPSELLHYAWSQKGVASALVGHFGAEILEENAAIAINAGGNEEQMAAGTALELERRMAHLAGPHALCWARPGYTDGTVC